jgi:hypothetical protein
MGCNKSKLYSDSHVTIETSPAFTSDFGGKIRLNCPNYFKCEWRQHGNAALLQLSEDRKLATNVPPGTYTMQATVDEINVPKIVKYNVTHATSDCSRDGTIEVETSNIDYPNVKYLWSTGVITEEPLLLDVSPGMYSVTLVSEENLPIPFFHALCPAIVKANVNEFMD